MTSLPYRIAYIVSSFAAALIAVIGIWLETPVLYGIVPGVLGGIATVVATIRFLKYRVDLAGFVATTCGFIFYQAFQANPVMLPEFTASLSAVPLVDQVGGIFLGNFTTGMILLAYLAVSAAFRRPLAKLVPQPSEASRASIDRKMLLSFWLVFIVVAIPNGMFGKVVVGAYKNILYQRASWAATGEFSGFEVWGGPVGASLVNMVFWSTSLFFIWLYLLSSQYRKLMLALSPLVLLWTASVTLQGSRTYLVTLGFGLIVYLLGNPKFGRRAYAYAAFGFPLLFVLVQAATLFRSGGLQSIDLRDLAQHLFEIRGNEGTSSQMDGLEFFRTGMVAKNADPNPLVGFVRGMVERPIEGILMPVPRSLFPWKPVDDTMREFSLFYQNVRLGVPSDEIFLGASPGLMGRELIRYGILGPLTVLFWLGLVLALADKLYATGAGSDFHRVYASVLVAFFVAEMRDWVPLWFLPFLPVMIILGYVARKARRPRINFGQRRPVARLAPRRHRLTDPPPGNYSG